MDPVGIPWPELCRRLDALTAPALERFVLGTAQLGLDYGIANTRGLPSDDAALALVDAALAAGVRRFDTARVYGSAEQRLGRAVGTHPSVALMTKLAPLDALPPQATAADVERSVDASVLRSCYELQRRTLDVVLLHRWADHDGFGGAAWQRLLALRADGLIAQLGASVLDAGRSRRRARRSGDRLPSDSAQRARPPLGCGRGARLPAGVVVHARSAFLQGLLVAPTERWPVIGGIDCGALVARLDALAHDLRREGRDDLALAYVRAKPWVAGIVIGVDSPAQLARNVALFRTPALDRSGIAAVERALPDLPVTLLDPSLWPVAR